MRLRPAVPGDMSVVADLWHEGWHVSHPGHVPDGLTARRTLSEFHRRAAGRAADTTVAVVGGSEGSSAADGSDGHDGTDGPGDTARIVGFVMVSGDEVEQVYVSPTVFGTGVASQLLAEGARQVAAAGHPEAWLAVVRGNARARRFYEREGWTDEGDLDYEVEALGERFISPCRRYTRRVGG